MSGSDSPDKIELENTKSDKKSESRKQSMHAPYNQIKAYF